MSEQYRCKSCGYVLDMKDMMCSECGNGYFELQRWTKGGDGSHWDGCEEAHWDCRIAHLEKELARRDEELKITDGLLKEATETIGAVIACCTYNSNDDAKIGIYGIDQNAFTRIDQFITHYNDAVSAGKVSVDVKRDLSDIEIRKEFCPNCEAETPCTHEAELYVCEICGEDFAKYIVSRNCNVSDVSMTQDVLTDVKTPRSIENNNPDYYKDELYLDEDFRMLAKTYPADVSAIGVTALIDYVEALDAELARRDADIVTLNNRLTDAVTLNGELVEKVESRDERIAELARLTAELALTEKKLCNIDRLARAEIARRDEIIARLKEDAERLAATSLVWSEWGNEYECVYLNCGTGIDGGYGDKDEFKHTTDCPIVLHRALMKELEG